MKHIWNTVHVHVCTRVQARMYIRKCSIYNQTYKWRVIRLVFRDTSVRIRSRDRLEHKNPRDFSALRGPVLERRVLKTTRASRLDLPIQLTLTHDQPICHMPLLAFPRGQQSQGLTVSLGSVKASIKWKNFFRETEIARACDSNGR